MTVFKIGWARYLADRIRALLWRLRLRRGVYYINGPETLPAPLSKEEEKKVFARLEQNDESAKETLTVHNLRLVVYIAKKFESTGICVEDLISIGTIGSIFICFRTRIVTCIIIFSRIRIFWVRWIFWLNINKCQGPVSYTHLDVYKRQSLLRDFVASSVCRWHSICLKCTRSGTDSLQSLNLRCATHRSRQERYISADSRPVSYTHLDVYKRQPLIPWLIHGA